MRTPGLTRGPAALLAALLCTLATPHVLAGSAHADTPAPAVAADFVAPLCPGTTDFDPAVNGEPSHPVTNLRNVFGARLTAYNAGRVVPLYDSYGLSGPDVYPPLCGTRYVAAAGGPVSEWMYCTDRLSQVCGDLDANGNLLDEKGVVINPLTTLTRNRRLTSAQERVISYLIQHGHAYDGIGDQYFDGAKAAKSNAGTDERKALQTLIWCVSDPGTSPSDFTSTCAKLMGPKEQARLLAMTPADPELTLQRRAAAVRVGQTARFDLTTNVFNQAITLTTGGTATARWRVCRGDATLNGSTLTVRPVTSGASAAVQLCARAKSKGELTVAANVAPPTTKHIGWNQSIQSGLFEDCQVFATFHAAKLVTLRASARSTVNTKSAAPAAPKTLPAVGAPVNALVGWGGLTAVTLGALLMGMGRRRRT